MTVPRFHSPFPLIRLLAGLVVGLLLGTVPVSAADPGSEQHLIQVLESNASPHDKDAACAQLKRIGTVQCIPALASLLADDQLSHSARYVLEGMSAPEAGRALIAALPRTAGPTRAGIINSLGARRERAAIPELAKLASAHDPAAEPISIVAAAAALGHIGGPEAVKALETAPWPATDVVHHVVVDALLRCAQDFLVTKQSAKALLLFQQIYEKESPNRYRIAAYRGMILSSGTEALPLATTAIAGQSGPAQVASLQLIHDGQPPNAAESLVKLLPKLDPPVQVALIGGLGQYGSFTAAPAIAAQVSSPSPEVRLAALKALGALANTSVISVLAKAAASGSPEEQTAARRALVDLRHEKTTDVLVADLTSANPAIQAELARALGDRGDSSAVPRLLALAQTGSGSVRKASLSALALLAGQDNLASLVQLVQTAASEAARAQAVETLNAACQHIQAQRGYLKPDPITKALASGTPTDRIALLPVCSGLVDPDVRSALRAALRDSNPQIRSAAIRALCDTKDTELLPDLLRVVREASEENFRTLAVAACVRLTTQEDAVKLALPQRLDVLKEILSTSVRADQKRLVLAGLAELPVLGSLELVQPLLQDPAVKIEAAQAAIKIAPALPIAQARPAAAALKLALAALTDSASRQVAESALKKIEASSQYITAWQAAGPYLEAGKNYAALFDIQFPPEIKDSQNVAWQPLATSADPSKPWLMDLLKAFGGEERVAYARTWVHCDAEQPARLEIGSDDGVKVWLNGQLVHAHNTFRGITPGSDKVKVTLKSGWNSLLLKVTQLNQGWEFCARFLKPDGSPIEGLRFEAREH